MNTSDSRTVGRSNRVRERGQVFAALVLAFLSVSPTVRLSAQLSPRDSAFHALNRLAYGPRPGEVQRVARERRERQREAGDTSSDTVGAQYAAPLQQDPTPTQQRARRLAGQFA